jgi:uncharacterized membrane protein
LNFIPWEKLFETHGGRMVGTLFGFVLGFIYLIVGFWKTVVFAMFVGLGYLWGWRLDRREDLEKVVSTILSDKWIRK